MKRWNVEPLPKQNKIITITTVKKRVVKTEGEPGEEMDCRAFTGAGWMVPNNRKKGKTQDMVLSFAVE